MVPSATPSAAADPPVAGRLLGIARRDVRRGPMQQLERAEVTREAGVARDFRGKPGNRQVTVLAAGPWLEACAMAGADLPWLARRANLLVDGVDLRRATGAVLRLGDDVELVITGELDPCARMDEAAPGLRLALAGDWRGGVTCRVRQGGVLALGAAVRVERP